MKIPLIVEIISVMCNIIFLVLLIKEKKQCWIYGILGSITGAYVFYENAYYSETLLYAFYAFVGIYGYYYWDRNESTDFTIKRTSIFYIVVMILGGALAGLGLGFLMSKTDAANPYYDAMSTSFGILATFLELYKYFVAWGFWILINAYTIWLYGIKDLNFFAFQMVIYTSLSIYGFVSWRKKMVS
ncbi:MAG: nicotinamide riboside transporter PnuC [Bacteroidia bacterium]|tara:strand:- start:5262 stop:5819 length:558 start_codon:yes stop_codon:yes gene_type:complete